MDAKTAIDTLSTRIKHAIEEYYFNDVIESDLVVDIHATIDDVTNTLLEEIDCEGT